MLQGILGENYYHTGPGNFLLRGENEAVKVVPLKKSVNWAKFRNPFV